MIVGETVVVERRQQVDTDGFNTPIYEWVPEQVDDVLVAPGPRADIAQRADGSESGRPDGTRIVWNLHFPKGYPADLRGARVRVRGGEPLDVVGNPQHYTPENTPGRWSMPVELQAVEG